MEKMFHIHFHFDSLQMLSRTIFSFWPLWICYIEPYISSLSFRWLVNWYCALSCSMLHMFTQYTVLHPYEMVIIHTPQFTHSPISMYVWKKQWPFLMLNENFSFSFFDDDIQLHQTNHAELINDEEMNIKQLNRQTTVLRKSISVYFPYVRVNAVWRMVFDDEINEPLFHCYFLPFVRLETDCDDEGLFSFYFKILSVGWEMDFFSLYLLFNVFYMKSCFLKIPLFYHVKFLFYSIINSNMNGNESCV